MVGEETGLSHDRVNNMVMTRMSTNQISNTIGYSKIQPTVLLSLPHASVRKAGPHSLKYLLRHWKYFSTPKIRIPFKKYCTLVIPRPHLSLVCCLEVVILV